MNLGLADLVRRFSGRRIAVVGEAMVDSYLEGFAAGLCREAPVPTVSLRARTDLPGGAANTAVNLAALGADVMFCSVVGEDAEATVLRHALAGRGIHIDHLVADPARRTLTKNRIVSDSQILIRFDHGTTDPLGPETEAVLIDRLGDLFAQSDAVILSDYEKGLLTSSVLEAASRLQARCCPLVVVDARDLSRYTMVRPSAVKPNYTEALRLLGLPRLPPGPERVAQIAGCGDRLVTLTGCHLAAVTLDADGALLFEPGVAPYRTYSRPVQNSRALGAGDTYVAALTLALAVGAPTHEAGELASAAAAVVISKERTSICSAAELTEQVLTGDKYIEHPDRLRGWVEIHRSQGRRLVFTNGCFDLLHRGHITYLSRAKTLGDVLIVGVNSDASVSRLKGPSRPINALKDRVDVLAALSCIDHVVSFEEDSPERLIEVIRPEVFVKGGDYTRETIREAPLAEALGGAVTVLPYEEGCSTTRLIERVGHAYGRAYGDASPEVMGL